MASSLSNLVKNFLKEFIELHANSAAMIKKGETYRIKYKYNDCFLENKNFKGDLIEYKCLCCKKNHPHKLNEKLKERFFNTYKFLTTTIISLFWMIGQNLMKHRYLK